MSPEALLSAAAASRREHLLFRRSSGYETSVTAIPDKLGAIGAAVAAFEERAIPYALIGGLAVGIHSNVPRATLDVDFAIPTTVDRTLLPKYLAPHGLTLTGTFPHSLNFQHSSGEPVQLAFDADFDPMVHRSETLLVSALRLRVVTKADLLTMKRRAAADPARRRSKALRDLADIALLEGDIPEPNEGW